jgi:hypothetical protein
MSGRAGPAVRAWRTGAARRARGWRGARGWPGARGWLGAALTGAACLAWAATPPAHHQGWAGLALFLAITAVAAGLLRLALAGVPVPEENYLLPVPLRVALRFMEMLRLVPWEEGALAAILWLEVLHRARPWHTAVLGAGLIAYLLITHLAESGAIAGTLRPQARVLAIGAGLLALGAGAGMLPALAPGAGSALLRLLAAAALVTAAGLVLPHVARGDVPEPPAGN